MKKIFILIFIIFIKSNSYAHIEHYKNIKKIEMNILKDGKVIGFCEYEFSKKGNKITVNNITKFEVKVLGMKIFSITSTGKEIYRDDKLISFESKTLQNNKRKYVDLQFEKNNNNYLIDGSSYKGTAEIDSVVGSWWNHKILTADKQISPLSGSIKEQEVLFINKENIVIDGTEYLVHKFTLKSKNLNLPQDKKLDFEIWYDPKQNLILKVAYNRLGKWEYILKKITFN